MDVGGKSDPYVILKTGTREVQAVAGLTSVISNTLNPVWNENFTLAVWRLLDETQVAAHYGFGRKSTSQPSRSQPSAAVHLALASPVGNRPLSLFEGDEAVIFW